MPPKMLELIKFYQKKNGRKDATKFVKNINEHFYKKDYQAPAGTSRQSK